MDSSPEQSSRSLGQMPISTASRLITIGFRLRLTDHRGVVVEVVCEGWFSLSVGYFRDDSFAVAGRVLTHDPRIEAARDAVSQRPPPSGSPSRDRGQFSLLEVDLDDGAKFECVAASLLVTFANAD